MLMAKEVSKSLSLSVLNVVRHLLPNGKKNGDEWCVGDIYGTNGDSLKVHLIGDKAGVWCDFATGDGGDLLDLWAKNRNLLLGEALKEAVKYLGIYKKIPEYHKKSYTFKEPEMKVAPDTCVRQYLKDKRGLEDGIIDRFKVYEHKGYIAFPSFRDGKLLSIKYMKIERPDGKKSMFVEKDCEPCLFGWQTIPHDTRRIIICEGEIDAMSMVQFGLPALSVPFGAGTGRKHQWIEYEFEHLAIFDEIFICMDTDEEGKKAAVELVERLGPHRCRIVELPMKDANECLVNGISSEDMKYFIEQAVPLDPEELRRHSDFTDEAYEIINPIPGKFAGYVLGWEKTGDSILFRPSGLTVWTGYNGHGKTLFLGQIVLNMIKQGARVCVASMELYPEELMARTYIQATAQEKPSRNFIASIDKWLDSKLYIFNLVGTGKIDRLLEVFLYARRRYGVDVFVVDSLTTLSIAEDDYTGQKNLTEMLRDFKLQHNCHIHLVAHTRKPRDEKEIPGKYDIRGGGAISDLADNCFAVWRDKEKERIVRKKEYMDFLENHEIEKLSKPDVYLKCDKNRHGRGKFKEGIIGFWFHEPSYQYLEREHLKPTPYLQYSCVG